MAGRRVTVLMLRCSRSGLKGSSDASVRATIRFKGGGGGGGDHAHAEIGQAAAEGDLVAMIELSHANRLATLGYLAASITHEMKQPIAAAVTNAMAGLRWLDRPRPDLDRARAAFDRIVRDGNRASNTLGRIRALIRKAPPRERPPGDQ